MESENAVIAKVSQSNYVSFLNSAGTFSYGLGLGVVLASLLSEGLAIIPTMLVTLGSFFICLGHVFRWHTRQHGKTHLTGETQGISQARPIPDDKNSD